MLVSFFTTAWMSAAAPQFARAALDALRGWSETTATVAVTAAWQGVAVAVALGLCLKLAPRVKAGQRFLLWASAFAVLVCLPAVALVVNSWQAANASAAQSATLPTSRQPLFNIDARWSLAITALWVAAGLARACALALHSIRVRAIWKQAKPVEVDESLHSLLSRIPVGRWRLPVEVCTSGALDRPCVIGFFKPRVLIPEWLWARLTLGELEQIVLHEAEHLRRGDDWSNLVQKLCLVLFPLNPALAWMERRLCREREMACDEGVIAHTRAPRAYAACLASLAERGLERRHEALSLGAWQRRPELANRVHSILRRTHVLGPAGSRALLGTLGCGLLFGSVMLALCPQLVTFAASTTTTAQAQSGSAETALASARPEFVAASPVAESKARVLRVTSHERTMSHMAHPAAEAARIAEPASEPAQQWIVLTSWEQTDLPNPKLGLIADYDLDATGGGASASETNAPARASADSKTPAKAINSISVTRLIFRIDPSSTVSNQPSLVPMHGGWLILQL